MRDTHTRHAFPTWRGSLSTYGIAMELRDWLAKGLALMKDREGWKAEVPTLFADVDGPMEAKLISGATLAAYDGWKLEYDDWIPESLQTRLRRSEKPSSGRSLK
jgi:hypothetical protein